MRRRLAAALVVCWLLCGTESAGVQGPAPRVFAGAPAALWIFPPGVAGTAPGVYHFRRVFALDTQPASVRGPRVGGQPLPAVRERRAGFVRPTAFGSHALALRDRGSRPAPSSRPQCPRGARVELGGREAGRPIQPPDGVLASGRQPARGDREFKSGVEGSARTRAIAGSPFRPPPSEATMRRRQAKPSTRDATRGAGNNSIIRIPAGSRRRPEQVRAPDAPSSVRATPSARPAAGSSCRARFLQWRSLRCGSRPYGEPRASNPTAASFAERAIWSCLRSRGQCSCWTRATSPTRSRYSRQAVAPAPASGSSTPRRSRTRRETREIATRSTGKTIAGVRDEFRPDGGNRRRFQTLWFRTYRYVQLEITTGDDVLHIHDLHGIFVGYPFELAASFSSDLAWLSDMWEINWRGARLCAWETYFDTPVLRTAPVRRRHAHPGADHALHEPRRSSRAPGDRAF